MKLTLLALLLIFMFYNNFLYAAQMGQQLYEPPFLPYETTLLQLLERQLIIETQNGDLTQESLLRLLTQGADVDVNAKDSYGNSALMLALLHDRIQTLEILIAANADVNIRRDVNVFAGGKCRHTALMMAVIYEHSQQIAILISAHADQNLVCCEDDNKTARDFAKDKNMYDKAVEAGKQRRAQYLTRQNKAISLIVEHLIPDLAALVVGYAYGPSTTDLPEITPNRETNTVKQPQPCCIVQ